MKLSGKLDNIRQELIAYCKDGVRLLKFEALEIYAGERSKIIVGSILALISIFLLLFAGITTALYLNTILNSAYAGFGIVALFWCIAFILVLIFRKNLINFYFNRFLDNNIPS